jgi:hypothetical protein
MVVGGQTHTPAASTPGKDPVPIVQEAGWTPGPVWTGGKSRPHRDSIPEPAVCRYMYIYINLTTNQTWRADDGAKQIQTEF